MVGDLCVNGHRRYRVAAAVRQGHSVSLKRAVQRRGSMDFVWMFTAIVVAVIIAILSLIEPFGWAGRIVLVVILVPLTSGRLQNLIAGLRFRLENAWRDPEEL